MVDPKFVTRYDRSEADLQEFMVFSVCVAGKDAAHTAKAVSKLRNELAGGTLETRDNLGRIVSVINCGDDPLTLMINEAWCHAGLWGEDALMRLIHSCGIGNYTRHTSTILTLAEKIHERDDFLRSCTVEELESIHGIGSKTARFFMLHSRPNARCAALDTHILHWLRDQGITAPKTTPVKGSKKYKELELTVLAIADKLGKSPAELDLEVWNAYSRNGLGSANQTSESTSS